MQEALAGKEKENADSKSKQPKRVKYEKGDDGLIEAAELEG
jgi:hypothetical protein